jgi:hypothetical protein
MAQNRSTIIAALEAERAASQKGVGLEVVTARSEDIYFLLTVKQMKGRSKVALDEGIEGTRVRWGEELERAGRIKFVDPDNELLVIEPALLGQPPSPGEAIWLFPNDFLGPLIDLWSGDMGRRALRRLRQTQEELEPLQEIVPLPSAFSELRERQTIAVQNSAYRCSLLIGPPGTGKSFTVGALGAYLLTRFSKARLLVVGPTNVAVDTAILAIDDWLQRLERPDLARTMKRIGAHFDPRKYVDRPHLLATGIDKKVNDYLLLELAEPPKQRIAEYVRWKDRMTVARLALGADVADTAKNARVVGVTVSTAVRWHSEITAERFPFLICDEASQVIGPAAMMAAAMADRSIFAGDPQQLSPIARTDGKGDGIALRRTAFDTFKHVRTTRLNEQSRMAQGICHAIGATFYDNDLMVCRKAIRDPEWKAARSPCFVDGREVPRICFDAVSKPCTYSRQYGGFIRFETAKLVENIADELAGSYVDPADVLVLTPFRAQRTLIKSFLRHRHPTITVSTIHRAQGSERSVVIFDPVDATSNFFAGREGERLINVAISRAKAHVIIPYHPDDLRHPALAKINRIASKVWQTSGAYARPFTFARAT